LLLLGVGCANTRWSASAHQLCSGRSCYHVGTLDPPWRLIHRRGAALGFFSPTVGGVILVSASCRDDADAAPLTALTNRLLIGYTERRTLSQDLVALDRREALRTVLEAKLDGVAIILDLYVLKRDGCILDLSLAAPAARYPKGRADFDRFVIAFANEKRS
jgi:hypothetical protein